MGGAGDQLMGRYSRLRQELSNAYGQRPWHSDRIDRLASELAATERDIAALGPHDEQCCDTLPSFTT